MSRIPVKILGTGAYLPPRTVYSEELERELGYAPGTFEKTSGVRRRFYAQGETSSAMGAKAAEAALETAQVGKEQIDAIISVSGVPQQAVPSMAALMHQKLELRGAVAFDINSTCLSFLTGFFCLAHLMQQGVYRRVLLVSADIASVGLNPCDPKTASLFGDGAAAAVLGLSEEGESGLLTSHFEILSQHAEACQCEAGGVLLAEKWEASKERLYFRMEGPRLFKAALPPLLRMINRLSMGVDLFIPHQASPFALDLLQRKLNLTDDRFVHIVRDFGNMIAASIPFALHQAIVQGKLQRGQRALLMGTGAGLTVGGIVIEY